jgi:hypothetical protein
LYVAHQPISHALTFSDDGEGQKVKLFCAFEDERWTKGRSVTDLDWSPKVSLKNLKHANDSSPSWLLHRTTRIPAHQMIQMELWLYGTCIYSKDPNLSFTPP